MSQLSGVEEEEEEEEQEGSGMAAAADDLEEAGCVEEMGPRGSRRQKHQRKVCGLGMHSYSLPAGEVLGRLVVLAAEAGSRRLGTTVRTTWGRCEGSAACGREVMPWRGM